jgi:outer membrane receptor for ferrienterochelin and colicins
MILIDGMPIVSSLASVYGLSGIPNSLIERMEIIKGPASSLYGSEAIGGVINVITKSPANAPRFMLDMHSTTWLENNLDIGFKNNISDKVSILTGINLFSYQTPQDNNFDNFTDIALQKRISIFQKWAFDRNDGKQASLAARYYTENRWGGELQWDESHRGGNEVYGESVYTTRWEIIGQYDLPWVKNLAFAASIIGHDQNSAYGDLSYLADQNIIYGQLIYTKNVKKHKLLFGSAMRYTYFDDNTPATFSVDNINSPDETIIPGFFIQDEIELNKNKSFLFGLRNDFHEDHGNIFTPRVAFKWKLNDTNTLRFNFGTGFRVVNLFTEDHAALTGAREVIIQETLNPEKSINFNLNYLKRFYLEDGGAITLDFSAWHTKFDNLILPDYNSHPNKIFYKNIDGHAVSKGVSINANAIFSSGITFKAGFTLLNVYSYENLKKTRPYLSENFNGTWGISYNWNKNKYKVDYTGNIYGPMLLPLAGTLDPRNPESPFWSIQNIQFTCRIRKKLEIYTGFKNLLNWTPSKNNPFLIARNTDPFDKSIEYDSQGNILSTIENPYGLSFDPSYVFAPNQGRKLFLGIRFSL